MKFSFENHVLSIVCSVFDAYSAVLFMPDEGGSRHFLAASFSLGDNIPEDTLIMPGKGLMGCIIQNRDGILLDNFDQGQSFLGYYGAAEENIKAFMGTPVPGGGALGVDSKRQYSFSEKDQKILSLFAELLGRHNQEKEQASTGESARYFAELSVIQDLRFRFRRWPEFLSNFLRAVIRALRFDYCAFATLQEDRDVYCIEAESTPLLLTRGQPLCMPLGAGITGWVFRNEQPVFTEANASPTALFGKLEDLPDFPSVICMPVMVNKSCKGVLCIANTSPMPIDDAARSFVRLAVDHLSLFLENLYLRNKLRRYMPKARLQYDGGRPYDPDTAPMPRPSEDDNRA